MRRGTINIGAKYLDVRVPTTHAGFVQLDFDMPTPKRSRKRRAGRPRKHAPGTGRHVRRHRFKSDTPIHVTMRLDDGIKNARKFGLQRALVHATLRAFLAGRVRIVHFSIQKTHLHAIVEAADARALARGMQGFCISAARQMNRVLGRDGRVFADRYHARYLTSPTQTRNAIRYVLSNWRHHGLDREGPFGRFRVDPYSNAFQFGGFSDHHTNGLLDLRKLPRHYEPLVTPLPRTWMLRVGWRERGGGTFSVWDSP
jgi:hypothetical protein